MKTKNLVISTAALIVVILLILISDRLGKRSPSEKATPFFPGVSTEDVSKLRIAGTDDTVMLVRKGDVWFVEQQPQAPAGEKEAETKGETESLLEGEAIAAPQEVKTYPADSAAITTALEKLQQMKKEVLVSKNPEKRGLFEVDTAKGTVVEAWNSTGESLGRVILGKSGPDWSSHYVRAEGSDKVYSVSGGVKHSFFSEPKRWKDKTVVSFDKSLARRLTIKKEGVEIVVAKETDTAGTAAWKLVSPVAQPAQDSAVEKLVEAFAEFKCADWETDASLSRDSMGLADPEMVVSVTLENGDTRTAMVGKKKKNRFWVEAKGKDAVFLVAEYNVNKLDKNLDDLKQPEETAAEDEATEEASGKK